MALPQRKLQIERPTEQKQECDAPYVAPSATLPLYARDRGPANALIDAVSVAVAQERAFADAYDSGDGRWPLLKTFLVLGAAGSFCWMLIGVAAYLIF